MTGPQSTLTVQEVLGLDPESERALWQWLLSMDLVATINGRRDALQAEFEAAVAARDIYALATEA